MKKARIRPIALGIFRQDGAILVSEGVDPPTGKRFYRPLGGGIEFGEHGHETLVREIREELGAEIAGVQYLATLENIFTYDGRPGHEIVQVYEARFLDPALYAGRTLPGMEAGAGEFLAEWKPLADFGPGNAPLYPDGLLELLAAGPDLSNPSGGIERRGAGAGRP